MRSLVIHMMSLRCTFLTMIASVSGLLLSPLASVVNAQSRDAESFAVFTAVLDSLYRSNGDRPPMVIVYDSLSWRQAGVAYRGKLLRPYRETIDPATIADFEHVTSHSIAFPREFRYKGKLHVLSSIEYEQIHTRGNSLASAIPSRELREMPYWIGFIDTYPRAWGVTVLSRVGFNADTTQALIYVRHQCGGGCFSSETIFLKKKKRRWTIAERIGDEGRESLGTGSMRYLGDGAHYLADRRRQQDSTRRAIADSIRLERAPRRIHGTVTNRKTDRPIPFAQVLMFGPHPRPEASATSPPRPDVRVVADKNGRYTISNPAIGVAMLVFLCPGPIYFDHASFGAPGLYVLPGTDTTFDFAANDLSACWSPTKIHLLEPGWFESAEARNATVPNDEERNVFSAAIQHVQASNPNERIVAMFTRTMLPCRFFKLCGRVQIPRLVHERIIDSSTVKDFRIRSANSAILKPSFAQSLGLRVITDAEFHYYSGEAAEPLGWPARDPETDSSQFWTAFRRLYGDSAAIVSVTEVGFNVERTEALVEVRIDKAFKRWGGRSSRMMFLRKRNDTWSIENDNVAAGITSGASEGKACVPVSPPPATISKSEIEKLAGRFELTLIGTGENERTTSALVRIGHNMPARWLQPPPSGPASPATFPQSFELIDRNGNVAASRTMGMSIIGIPRNVVRDPRIMQFDGFYQNLTILNITDSGFYGSFVAGVFGDSSFGYFCARRTTTH
jgi:hypothetical protein